MSGGGYGDFFGKEELAFLVNAHKGPAKATFNLNLGPDTERGKTGDFFFWDSGSNFNITIKIAMKNGKPWHNGREVPVEAFDAPYRKGGEYAGWEDEPLIGNWSIIAFSYLFSWNYLAERKGVPSFAALRDYEWIAVMNFLFSVGTKCFQPHDPRTGYKNQNEVIGLLAAAAADKRKEANVDNPKLQDYWSDVVLKVKDHDSYRAWLEYILQMWIDAQTDDGMVEVPESLLRNFQLVLEGSAEESFSPGWTGDAWYDKNIVFLTDCLYDGLDWAIANNIPTNAENSTRFENGFWKGEPFNKILKKRFEGFEKYIVRGSDTDTVAANKMKDLDEWLSTQAEAQNDFRQEIYPPDQPGLPKASLEEFNAMEQKILLTCMDKIAKRGELATSVDTTPWRTQKYNHNNKEGHQYAPYGGKIIPVSCRDYVTNGNPARTQNILNYLTIPYVVGENSAKSAMEVLFNLTGPKHSAIKWIPKIYKFVDRHGYPTALEVDLIDAHSVIGSLMKKKGNMFHVINQQDEIMLESVKIDLKGGDLVAATNDVVVTLNFSFFHVGQIDQSILINLAKGKNNRRANTNASEHPKPPNDAEQYSKGAIHGKEGSHQFEFRLVDLILTPQIGRAPKQATGSVFTRWLRNAYHPDFGKIGFTLDPVIHDWTELNSDAYMDPEEKKMLETFLAGCQMRLELSPVDHTITKSDEDNRGNLAITFQAAQSSLLGYAGSDAFSTPSMLAARAKREAKLNVDIADPQAKTAFIKKQLAMNREADQKDLQESLNSIYHFLTEKQTLEHHRPSRMHTMAFLTKVVRDSIKNAEVVDGVAIYNNMDHKDCKPKMGPLIYPKFGGKGGQKGKALSTLKNKNLEMANLFANGSSAHKRFCIIKYFYFGDLLDAITQSIYSEMESVAMNGQVSMIHSGIHDIPDRSTKDLKYEQCRRMQRPMFYWDFNSIDPASPDDAEATPHRVQSKCMKWLLADFKYLNQTRTAALADGCEHFSTVNLAHVPISWNWFSEWMQKNVVEQKTTRMTINNFINKLLKVLTSLLNRSNVSDGTKAQPLILKMSPYKGRTAYGNNQHLANLSKTHHAVSKGLDIATYAWRNQCYNAEFGNSSGMTPMSFSPGTGADFKIMPYLKIFPTKEPLLMADPRLNITEYIDYMLIHQISDRKFQPVKTYSKLDDYKNVLPTISQFPGTIGGKTNPKGGLALRSPDVRSAVFKTISFQKNNYDGKREAIYHMNKYGSVTQLSSVYDVTVGTFFALPFIYPGHLVAIESDGLGAFHDCNSLAWKLGFGGYHYVINVGHSFEYKRGVPIFSSTSFTCKWQSSGTGGKATEDCASTGIKGKSKKDGKGEAQEACTGPALPEVIIPIDGMPIDPDVVQTVGDPVAYNIATLNPGSQIFQQILDLAKKFGANIKPGQTAVMEAIPEIGFDGGVTFGSNLGGFVDITASNNETYIIQHTEGAWGTGAKLAVMQYDGGSTGAMVGHLILTSTPIEGDVESIEYNWTPFAAQGSP